MMLRRLMFGFVLAAEMLCLAQQDDAGLLEVDFHYLVDSAGSRQEFIK